MGPTERTLDVLEYLDKAGPQPVKQIDIVRDLGLSAATLNRIVSALSDRGFLFRTSEKYLVRNFSLQRTIQMSSAYLEELDASVQRLAAATGAAAEAVVVVGHELLWHQLKEHSDPTVSLTARKGFRRTLLELDALSRLYLSTLEDELTVGGYKLTGFYKTGGRNAREMRWLDDADAAALVRDLRGETFASDTTANHRGIRRFAMLVTDLDGKFLHFLSIADNAPDGTGVGELANAYRAALERERVRLHDVQEAERRRIENETRLRLVK